VDRRIGFIQNEIIALNRSFDAAQDLVNQWQQNDQQGNSPAIPEASIRTMRLSLRGMRRNLDTIEEILDGSPDA
jgi:hypothetical protein